MRDFGVLKVVWSNWHRVLEDVIAPEDAGTFAISLAASNPDPPPMLEFYEEATGLALALGVGAAETVVTFQYTLDPPYFISLGDPTRLGVVQFCYGRQWSEYLASNLVAWEAALAALREFAATGARPSNIGWEQL